MSPSNNDPRNPPVGARISRNIDDLTTPGAVVEVDAGEAESLGAFEETALSEADAWDANCDLEAGDEEVARAD
jgi:hypothetical protein